MSNTGLTLYDLMFAGGCGVSLTGCWLLGQPTGLIGTGVVICVLATVLHQAGIRRKRMQGDDQ